MQREALEAALNELLALGYERENILIKIEAALAEPDAKEIKMHERDEFEAMFPLPTRTTYNVFHDQYDRFDPNGVECDQNYTSSYRIWQACAALKGKRIAELEVMVREEMASANLWHEKFQKQPKFKPVGAWCRYFYSTMRPVLPDGVELFIKDEALELPQ